MNFIASIFFLAFLFSTATGYAQHHNHNSDTTKSSAKELKKPFMAHSFSKNLPMSRNGSGTAWLPDESPMYGYMNHSKNWMYMFHGNIFLRYNNQDLLQSGSRGDSKFDITNWFMWMGQTSTGDNGLFRFSTMVSLDPVTVGGEGYPLLFQSGETWQGVPLVDSQHPHDLFSELSVAYSYMLSENSDAFVYLAYPGEPAFGPVAFMHRVSGINNPDAPIGHHWQDATHITFGVGTLGFRYQNLKVEGSIFTGREPNEERYGFDRPRFDSWSARFSFNLSPSWALQVSKAWVKDIHELGPTEDVNKTSASALHSIQIGKSVFLNSALIWGYNRSKNHHGESNSILLESALNRDPYSLFMKYEWVEKSSEDLLLDEAIYDHDMLYDVNTFTIGVQRDLVDVSKLKMALGGQGTIYFAPNSLKDIYGSLPIAAEFYFRIYPSRM